MQAWPEKSEALTAATGRASSEVTQAIKQGSNVINSKALTIGTTSVRQVGELYSLNDLHHASGGADKHAPHQFTRLEQTLALIAEIKSADQRNCIETRRGKRGGTYVCKELVIAYAAWISAAFHLKVIRVFLAAATPFSVHADQTLSQEQADTLRNMLTGSVKKLPQAKQAGAMVKGWSKLKSHFKTDYRHIPAVEFHEAVNILARHIAEWEVVDDAPQPVTDNEKIKHAYALASEVAKQAAITVFNAVVDDQDVHKHDRWMFHMDWHARDGAPAAWAKPVEGSAMVVSMADLPRRLLEPNGMLPTNKELADLATACNQRLAQRLQHEASTASRLAA
ncbi:KilA-N domain-containing protein [Comamonas sp. CMM03]|nr:KilA-N domain-containing protein [Comamonas sp. CMM03]MBV7417899.1 KilA-N domain-containing protein [Comamonas sp. CMM03]